MKKLFSILLVMVMIFSLSACGAGEKEDTSKVEQKEETKEDTFKVTLKNGNVEEMTHDQLADLYNNSLKLEDYLGAEVIGSGKLESIIKENNGTATLKVDFMNFEISNVPIETAKTFNVGDTVPVAGTLTRVFGCIVYLNGYGYY